MSTDSLALGGAGGGHVFDPSQFLRITNLTEEVCPPIRSDCDPKAVANGHGQLVPELVQRWRGKKAITGKYAGRWYVFPQGEPVDVHQEVARHLFGYLESDKSTALSRLGWMRTSDDLDAAMERLKNVLFEDLPNLMEVPKKAALASQESHSSASGLAKSVDEGPGEATPPAPDKSGLRRNRLETK